MPASGSSSPHDTLPTRRRRSRTVPIAIILLVSLVTLIAVISPLRYFYAVPPAAELSELSYSPSDSHTIDLRPEERETGRFKSYDSSTFHPLSATRSPSERVNHVVEKLVDTVGDLVLALFGFNEEDWFDFSSDGLTDSEEWEMRELGIEGIGGVGGAGGGSGSGLSSWSESNLYVERTQSLHPSRPSAFGPHLLEKPLRGYLYPISLYSDSSSPYGCSLPSTTTSPVRVNNNEAEEEEEEWIALVERGECPFSNKVRIAQSLGAKAVVFGDESEEEGGIKGGKGLLTPWSPDDTKDIKIPSIFVSRASYLSLIKTWKDEQRIVLGGQSELEDKDEERKFVGLEVVLSKDEMFAWPLLDLLFLLLFLPSLLTLLTVFTQRVRMARAQKAERAPKSAVAKLVVFKWGEPSPEKPTTNAGSGSSEAGPSNAGTTGDEEREIGLTLQPRHQQIEDPEESATESTSLLRPTPSSSSSPSTSPSLLSRLRSFLPSRLPFRLRRHSSYSLKSPSSSSLPLRGPNPKYPSLTDCSICLESFVKNESIVIELPCSHLFHRDCAMSWLLTRKGCCPICRKSVMDDDHSHSSTEQEDAGAAGGGAE